MKFVKTSNGNISAFVEGKSYHITPESVSYEGAYKALQDKDVDAFYDCIVDVNRVNNFCEGYINFDSGQAMWDDVPMPSLFSDRILELVDKGEEFGPMIRFTINLAENPSEHSILELIDFLRHKHLPITNDGCFLGYKAVKRNYLDIHSGTIDNSIGETPSVPREKVDSNRARECSYGLHVGAIDYVTDYGNIDLDDLDGNKNRIVIVKVDPKDVVSVPADHNFQKLRCCRYTVLGDYNGHLDKPIYDDAVFLDTQKGQKESLAIEEYLDSKKKDGKLDWVKEKLAKLAYLISGKR